MTKPRVRPHRRGAPAPLPLYVGTASAIYARALSAAMTGERPPALEMGASDVPSGPQVAAEAATRLRDMMAGIDAWRAAPVPPVRPIGPPIWQMGTTCLRDARMGATGKPILVVPSLINGPQVLDLSDEVSLLERLVAEGRRPVLVDWGSPGPQERGFDLSDYVMERLVPAADWLAQETSARPDILGYCMGGTLSIALAERAAGPEERLCLIGAPWSFGGMGGVAGMLQAAARTAPPGQMDAAIDALVQTFGVVPRDLFQLLFALLDPTQATTKFRDFVRKSGDKSAAARFVAVEDWLNGGPPLAGPAARQLLLDWYTHNSTATGRWLVDGDPADPRRIRAKSLVIYGARDHITPPAATAPLAGLIPRCKGLETPFGHVGMIASPRAQDSVAGCVAAFFGDKA